VEQRHGAPAHVIFARTVDLLVNDRQHFLEERGQAQSTDFDAGCRAIGRCVGEMNNLRLRRTTGASSHNIPPKGAHYAASLAFLRPENGILDGTTGMIRNVLGCGFGQALGSQLAVVGVRSIDDILAQ
jgi:hypothetical protein